MATIPIIVRRVLTGSSSLPLMRRLPQNAGSTALSGVPVLMTSGVVDESPAINDATDQILGFSLEFFQDLTTDDTPDTLHYGSVQNQANAVLIPAGAPPSDGKIGVALAVEETEFIGRLGSTQSLASTALGSKYGLTKDTNNQWYVDTAKTTEAGGACLVITEVIDPDTDGGLVSFTILANRYQWANF